MIKEPKIKLKQFNKVYFSKITIVIVKTEDLSNKNNFEYNAYLIADINTKKKESFPLVINLDFDVYEYDDVIESAFVLAMALGTNIGDMVVVVDKDDEYLEEFSLIEYNNNKLK